MSARPNAPHAKVLAALQDPTGDRGRVLIVDDDPVQLTIYRRYLEAAGYVVETAEEGKLALHLLKTGSFDVVVSDISMPGMDGLALLRRVRHHDFDLPVILVTGRPSFETAVLAIEHGALLYLVKPVDRAALLSAVMQAYRLYRLAKLRREALAEMGGGHFAAGDRSGMVVAFDRALKSLRLAFQPIVSFGKKKIHAYEALMRSTEPALSSPPAFLEAAEQLGRLDEVGRAVRARAAEALASGATETLYVNLHPADLADESLVSRDESLWKYADRVVLEITERAALEKVKGAMGVIAQLRKAGFRIALDDLGAGYAGLSSFAMLEPDIVKLDMSLIRNVDSVPTKRKLVASMITLCRDMKMAVIAEGIETPAERDACVEMGCDLLQGYLFAMPALVPPSVTF